MTATQFVQPARNPFARLFDALLDPARRERVVLAMLAVYTAVWTWYGVIAKSSQDIHFDMAELVAWSRVPALGYDKHPPFAAWVVQAWFTIFPLAEWSYYLLAMVTASAALWIAWRLAADYLSAERQVLALALLTLVPFFNFHALKFNVNTVLMPLWAATTFAFLRSYQRRSVPWAALAGIAAAAAMLTKYWSIFLLLALAVAALLDSRRAAYFRSPAPWISAAVGAILIGPHLYWLIAHDFAPLSYALARHGHADQYSAAAGALSYLAGSLGYVALPLLLVLVAARPGGAVLMQMAWPRDSGRRLVALAFWGPLLLPALAAPVFGIVITSLWSMSAWTLFGVMVLSPSNLELPRRNLLGIFTFACVLPFVMAAVSPVVAIAIQHKGVPPHDAQASLLTRPVEELWKNATGKPLRIVGGDLAYKMAFYLPGTPSAFPLPDLHQAPWIDADRLARDGLAIVCEATSQMCLASAEALAAASPGTRRTEITVARRFAGTDGEAARFLILAVPPAQ